MNREHDARLGRAGFAGRMPMQVEVVPDDVTPGDAVAAAHHRLADATVCLVARQGTTPLETAELAGFTDTLTQCAAAVTRVHFNDVHELYLQPAVQLLTDADAVIKFTHGPFNRTGLLPAVLDSLGVHRAGHPSSTDLLSQRKSLVKQLMLRHAFENLQLHRVALSVFEFNQRAIRSYRRCGFQVEGRAREAIWREGRWWDEITMSILEPEWRAMREPAGPEPERPTRTRRGTTEEAAHR